MSAVPRITLNDGHEIPQIGLGLWKVSDDEAEAIVLNALEAGYRHLDDATLYGNEAGVGRAIAASGIPREEIFVTTKLWPDSLRRTAARAAIETSLEKLGLDHVDLYLIHWPAPMRGQEYVDAWGSLIDFRSEGLATSIGVSNFLPEHLDAIIDDTGIVPVVNQIELHPTFQPHDLISQCADLGIAIEAWSPLGHRRDLAHPDVVAIAAEHGVSPAQVILRWHLDRGFVALPKSVSPERQRQNLDLFGFRLTPAQRAAIDAANTGVRLGADPLKVGAP
ncbi:MAG TPA: aldo/keto reductase [Arachnia sp.]|nr:aldo/keto reductase [Arachnia sp.]HMT86980.1 aldo/keto reductase [Arachnia sp.]